MRFRKRQELIPEESSLKSQIFRLRGDLAQELGGEDLPAMEGAIYRREELNFLFSRGYLFNTPRFAGMVVITYDNDDNLVNPGYERGTQYRLSMLGETEGSVVAHRYYSGNLLSQYPPDREQLAVKGALQAVIDLRRQGEGERVV